MVPVLDKHGVEQGGSSSGDQFQLTTNAELKGLYISSLGCWVSGIHMSNGAFADDTFLISNYIQRLQVLLVISEHQTAINFMRNVPTKTPLIILNLQKWKNQIPSIDPTSTLNMGSSTVSTSSEAKNLIITRFKT